MRILRRRASESNDAFQLRRAIDAEAWLRSPAYKRELERDRRRRRLLDRSRGHVDGCSLTRCADGCRSSIATITIPRGF